MEKVFAEIFSKEPDKIIGGDYFYHNPWLEEILATEIPKAMKMPHLSGIHI